VAKINNKTLTAPPAINETELIRFSSPPPINVSSVPAGNISNSSAPLELCAPDLKSGSAVYASTTQDIMFCFAGVALSACRIVEQAHFASTASILTVHARGSLVFAPKGHHVVLDDEHVTCP
jgi:hypothetical protein